MSEKRSAVNFTGCVVNNGVQVNEHTRAAVEALARAIEANAAAVSALARALGGGWASMGSGFSTTSGPTPQR